MIWTLYVCCFALMILVGIIAVPSDVRMLILENCKNSKGQFRGRYVAREAVAISRFYGQLLFTAAIIAVVLIFGLIVLDNYVTLDIVSKAVQQADWDFGKWEESLRSSPSNIQREFEQFHVSQGGSKESARDIMIFLWKGLPIMILFCFVGLLVSMRLSSKVFDNALQTLIAKEVERNRRRIQRRYLRSTSR
ncbi:MAG: hypothetical protein WBD20_02605 [Pirellulaceae bacterium]